MPRTGGYFNTQELDRPDILPISRPNAYTENYRGIVFTVWYGEGKPSGKFLRTRISDDEFGNRPSAQILQTWIKDDFSERAKVLDAQVTAQINERLIAEKVEMLNRHAQIGKEMVDISAKYLRDHENQLTINSSVRLLVAGIEIERDSRGISTTVQKIAQMNDDQLESEIKRLLLSSPVEFEPVEGEDIDIDIDLDE